MFLLFMNKKLRQQVFEKFNGKCAYSGTELESDWQVDHVKPVIRNWIDSSIYHEQNDCIENMFPTQKLINHYKHSYSIEDLRHYLSMVHEKLAKLPKNPRTEKSKRRIVYMNKLAGYFGITPDKAFSGKFYFEEKSLGN